MTETKYGKIPKDSIDQYRDKLVGRVFKILPMKEENSSTLGIYIESLLYELIGNEQVVHGFERDPNFLSLIGSLESLMSEEDTATVKREVFKCLETIKKI